jgi:hypothetical protein
MENMQSISNALLSGDAQGVCMQSNSILSSMS